MRALISDLLDATHIETGTLSVAPAPSDLAVMVDQARKTFLSSGGRHPVQVDLPAALPRVLADRPRIVQVLGNLLSNAGRHSPESSTIRVAAVREGVQVAVSVTDEGRGSAQSDGKPSCGVLSSCDGDNPRNSPGPPPHPTHFITSHHHQDRQDDPEQRRPRENPPPDPHAVPWDGIRTVVSPHGICGQQETRHRHEPNELKPRCRREIQRGREREDRPGIRQGRTPPDEPKRGENQAHHNRGPEKQGRPTCQNVVHWGEASSFAGSRSDAASTSRRDPVIVEEFRPTVYGTIDDFAGMVVPLVATMPHRQGVAIALNYLSRV